MTPSSDCLRMCLFLPVVVGAFLLLLGRGEAMTVAPWVAGLGGAQADAADDEVTNTWCPVITDEKVDPGIHGSYRGVDVFFCCRKCLRQFEAAPDEYVVHLPADFFDVAPPVASSLDDHASGEGPDRGHDEGGTPAEHDHADHGSPEQGDSAVSGFVGFLGRFHPMVVHFPIALILGAALAELLSVRTRVAGFTFTSRFCLWTGTLGAVFAAALGWADAAGVVGSYSGFNLELLEYHRWAGTTTAVVALATLMAAERSGRGSGGRPWRRAHVIGLGLLVVLIGATGHLGSSLIYGWDYLLG